LIADSMICVRVDALFWACQPTEASGCGCGAVLICFARTLDTFVTGWVARQKKSKLIETSWPAC
jgi:hypothetical protein